MRALLTASDRGATGVEYAMIIMVLTVGLVAGGALLAPRVASGFGGATGALSGTASATSASATPSPSSNGRGDYSCPRGWELRVSRGVRTCVPD